MFCTNCGSQLPNEKVKFCPNCGFPIEQNADSFTETAVENQEVSPVTENTAEVIEEVPAPEQVQETPVETIVEEPVTEYDSEGKQETVPVITEEPVSNDVHTEPVKEEPVSSNAMPVKKTLHFTATVSIVLFALSFVLSMFLLMAVITSMHYGILIFLSIFLLLTAPLAFGFAIAAFIVGLRRRRPAEWIIGLVAGLNALLINGVFGFIYLILGILTAV